MTLDILFQSTATILTSSHGDLIIQHRVRSVKQVMMIIMMMMTCYLFIPLQVPCHQLASVSWITASAGLFLVFTLTAVSLGYRRMLRARPPGDNNNNNNNISNSKKEEGGIRGKVKDTQISVISESYA